VIPFAFAILTLAGSWYTWRRNPMYSRRRTLHFLLATILSIAAVIAVIYSVIQLMQGRSENFQITAILVAVLVCSIGLIWIIVTITTPKPTPLPEGVQMATLHRDRLAPWIKRMAWALAVCGLLALVPSHAGSFNWIQFFALFIGAWVLGLGSILLAAGYIGGRNLDRALTSVLANPWVHWTYTPEEWSISIERQVAQAQAQKPKAVSLWIAFLVIAFPIAIGMYFADLLPLWGDLFVGVGFAGLITGILELSTRRDLRAPERMRARLNSAPHESFLGPDGIFANGRYNPWLSSGIYVTGATVEQSTRAAILFQFEKINAGRTAGTTQFVETVPLPSALSPAEIDAQLALLQQRLSRLVRAARIHIA
jgi:hypothetical protein